MKTLFMLAVSLLVLDAQAEVKAPGTVLATSCATKVEAAKPTEVCYASVVGLPNSYLRVGSDVWAFVTATSLNHVGLVVNGQLQYRLTSDIREAQFKQLGSDAIEITSGGQTVLASDFEIVFHTMSVN